MVSRPFLKACAASTRGSMVSTGPFTSVVEGFIDAFWGWLNLLANFPSGTHSSWGRRRRRPFVWGIRLSRRLSTIAGAYCIGAGNIGPSAVTPNRPPYTVLVGWRSHRCPPSRLQLPSLARDRAREPPLRRWNRLGMETPILRYALWSGFLTALRDTQLSFAAISSRVTSTASCPELQARAECCPSGYHRGSDESAGRPHRQRGLVAVLLSTLFEGSIRLAVPVAVQWSISLKLSSDADCAVGGAFHFCSGPKLQTSTIICVQGSLTGSSLSPRPIQRPQRSVNVHEFA